MRVLLLLVALAACDDMTTQPKPRTYGSDTPDGIVIWHEQPQPPPRLDLALMERGQDRFRIYCSPCHGLSGDGDGRIVQRGFTHPPSYRIDRLRDEPPNYFYDVITQGHGAMFSYAERVPPRDRWAIAAYIKALQAAEQ
jgi:mono/diheme cytochrome c family protein